MAQALSSIAAFPIRFPRGARLFALLRTLQRRMAERDQLARFDARELHDVGLTDADRAAIIDTPIWREAGRRR